jgi:hypothetical protein
MKLLLLELVLLAFLQLSSSLRKAKNPLFLKEEKMFDPEEEI